MPDHASITLPHRPKGTHHRAFSIIELLTAILILSILAALALPALGALRSASLLENSANITLAATTNLRSRAVEPVANLPGQTFRGVAAVFAEVNNNPPFTIQLLRHDQAASTPAQARFNPIENAQPFDLPLRAGIAGVTLGGSGMELIMPPFAIRFDRDGRLIGGSNVLVGTDARPTVVGVVVFPRDLFDPFPAAGNTLSAPQRDLVLSEGRLLMFNRYTGTDLVRGAR